MNKGGRIGYSEDLHGRVFGLLTVEIDGISHCLCRCRCGTLKRINRWRLTHQQTRSCGCLRAQNPGPVRSKMPESDQEIDWRKSNTDIALIYHVSRQLVSRMRLELEKQGTIPRYEHRHRKGRIAA